MNTSVINIFHDQFVNTSSLNSIIPNVRALDLSVPNRRAMLLLKSFLTLKPDWDSYGAKVPSSTAILKASSFILWLSDHNLDVFFVAPSPDGDIVIELKEYDSSLEFEFVNDENDTVTAIHGTEIKSEADLNETTLTAYIKWLICPYGNCPPDFR